MKSTLALVAFLITSSAFAQVATPTPNLTTLFPGYDPTLVSSVDAAQDYLDGLPMGFKEDVGILGIHAQRVSQCYDRAELWSYHLHKNAHVNAMKVFVFYTHKYRNDYEKLYRRKSFDWWFHVAPYLLVKNEQGEVEERVIDPEFSDTPMTMREWTDLFIETNRACKEWVPYEKFKNEVEDFTNAIGTEHCYLVRAPGTDLEPEDIAARQLGQKTGYEFSKTDLQEALTAPTNRNLPDFQKSLGLQHLQPKHRPDKD